MNKTVQYALVAFWEKSGCKIVADYPTKQDPAYRAIALSTVDGLKSLENDKISLDRGKYTVHVLIGELHYACLTLKPDCPSSAAMLESCSQLFLERLRSIYRELPILADLTSDLTNLAVIDLSKPLKKIVDEYNRQESEIIPRLEGDLAEIRGALMEGVQKLIDRGQRLDELVRKTQSLQIMNCSMASVAEFRVDLVDFQEKIERWDHAAEATRHLYFIAARRIQAWIRGILTRNHFRLLHESAVIVQRHWRGYRTRTIVDRCLIERVHQMWQDHYDKMATRIQALWRGYWTRRTALDIRKMRQWLDQVYAKNEETVMSMKKFRQQEIDVVQAIIEQESMQWILFVLFKLHHLLRTAQRPGVLTKIDSTKFTLIEEMLKCLEYRRYMRRRKTKSKEKCRDCQIDQKPSLILRGTYYERCEREIREVQRSLEAGIVPIFRSEPFEDHEKNQRKLNRIRLQASIDQAYERSSSNIARDQDGGRRKTRRLRKELEQEACCAKEEDLCKKIEAMDCHLKQLRLRCPIHDPSYSM
ncbi:Spermatogenesis-associated protein 17 [Eufriesea mexicana]|nr:Spermatogenesis-associated protein 17 [Eufriesea mexicana]